MQQIRAQGDIHGHFPCAQITSRSLRASISLAFRNAWCHPSPHLA